jgi:hypothetical protein
VAELLRAGEAEALHARFGPALAAEVPLESLRKMLAQTLAAAPIGARIGESALPLGPGWRIYRADHRWGDGSWGSSSAWTGRARS